jgi:hypothetical protein
VPDNAFEAATILLMFVVLPVWILAGLADYFCHRATRIETNAGTPESVMHLLQLGLIALPTILALFVEINAGFFALAALAILLHHLVTYCDLRYAVRTRPIWPVEQMVHSFLELSPITAYGLLAVLFPEQFLALNGLGPAVHDFAFHLKSQALPLWYVTGILAGSVLLDMFPYLEEFMRCLRTPRRALAA